jgi:hypothetical protein
LWPPIWLARSPFSVASTAIFRGLDSEGKDHQHTIPVAPARATKHLGTYRPSSLSSPEPGSQRCLRSFSIHYFAFSPLLVTYNRSLDTIPSLSSKVLVFSVQATMITMPILSNTLTCKISKRRTGQSPSPRPSDCPLRATKGGSVDTTKINIAGMLRKWKRIPASYRYLLTDRGFEVLRVQQIRRILEGCDRKSRS